VAACIQPIREQSDYVPPEERTTLGPSQPANLNFKPRPGLAGRARNLTAIAVADRVTSMLHALAPVRVTDDAVTVRGNGSTLYPTMVAFSRGAVGRSPSLSLSARSPG
jgi:hypothetical protein